MDNGDGQQIQLPPGYEDAKITKSPSTPSTPSATQSASQNTSGIVLPPGYEDAQVTKSPSAPTTQPSSTTSPTKSRGQRIWDAILHPETSGASSINLGSQGGDAPQSLPANNPGGLETGAEKGLAATMGGISGHLGGPGAEPQEKTPSSPAEWTGYAMEGLAEFYAGDEAFKALSMADKLKKLQSVAETLAEHPMLSKLAAVGARSLRFGTVAGLQDFAHGATAGQAAKTGGEVAGTTAVLDAAVIPAASKVAKYVLNNPFRQTAQKVATSAIQEAAGVGAEVPIIKGAESALDEPVKDLWQQKIDAYAKIDKEAGFDVKEAKDQLRTDQYNLKQTTDPATESKLWQRIRENKDRIAEAETKLNAAGIDPQSGAAANTRWQAGRAFKNVVVRNTAPDGTVNIDTLLKQSKMLRYNKFGDRLAQFTGSPEKADAFMAQLDAAQKTGIKTVQARKLAAWTGKIAGSAALGSAAYEGAKTAWNAIFGEPGVPH